MMPISRRWFLSSLLGGALWSGHNAPGPRPNFLFILLDDFGWRDVGYNGSSFYETPNIDQLAGLGMRFSQAYAASPYCSPTRAGIQTGKNPARLGITTFIGYRGARVMRKLADPPNASRMPLEEMTLGEAFQQAGYATSFVGKWHCGDRPSYPDKQGYGHMRGVSSAQAGKYFAPYRPDHFDNLPDGPEGEFLCDRLTDETLAFLRTQARNEQPFLAFLSTYSMHGLIDAKDELVAKYKAKLAQMPELQAPEFVAEGHVEFSGRGVARKQQNAVFAAMLETLDTNIGRLLAALEQLGLADNTVVVLMGDNGGLATKNTAIPRHGLPERHMTPRTLPCAGEKVIYSRGGIRVPLVVRWPGATRPGSVCDVPVVSPDFYPTFLDMAGLPARPDQHLDGETLVPLLKGGSSLRRKAIYWHMPQYGTTGDFPGRQSVWAIIS